MRDTWEFQLWLASFPVLSCNSPSLSLSSVCGMIEAGVKSGVVYNERHLGVPVKVGFLSGTFL